LFVDDRRGDLPVVYELWCDLPVQAHTQKYFRLIQTQITGLSVRPVPEEGRLAIVANVGMGCGGRSSVAARFLRADERH
jgi:hypothetical protein